MSRISIHSVLRFLSLSWLTGPIFDKELRVSSRRRRNYTLRLIYVIMLSFFVAIVWLSVVRSEGSSAYQKSRMALAGKTIVTTIVMFQFFATQVIAVIMLSTSISDEIYHRTLGLLMTTPIGSFQIVMGKLFSKLLQIILLLAISLPLLAIVRVFGGVPWNYVLSSLCITLTAVIFAGSLSLYFSINNRRAYVVIIKTVVTLGVLFFFIPTITTVLFSPRWLFASRLRNPSTVLPLMVILISFLHVNPFGAMSINTATMISPMGLAMFPVMPARGSFFYWPLHCVLMLMASALLIVMSVKVVRKVALRQATGQIESAPNRKRAKKSKKSSRRPTDQPVPAVSAGEIRRVTGSPVLWRELRAPMIQGTNSRNSIIGLTVTIIALLITYWICIKEDCLDQAFTQTGYMLMFLVLGSIFTMVLASTSVTTEKETQSWPILLATSMDDWQILIGKAVGVFRRCAPIWLLMTGHIIFFICFKYIHPVAILHMSISVTGLIIFLTGAGLYFSSRFKRTTSAVLANFALALTLWAILPALFGLVSAFTQDYDAVADLVSANPVFQISILMDGAGGSFNARSGFANLNFNWPKRFWHKVWPTTGLVIIYMLIYTVAGVLFAWRAKSRFRRNVF